MPPEERPVVKARLEDALGVNISATNPLPVTSEIGIESGTATGGTDVTLIDTTKGWQVNIWEDAILEVEIGGIQYTREIDSNTANALDFTTNPLLPPGVVVVGGCPYSIKRVVSPLNPLDKGVIHNTGYTTPNDFFVAAIAPTNTPCLFRLAGAFDAAGVLSATITRTVAGVPVTVTVEFNHGVVLTANSLFEFDLLVKAGDTINYRYSVNATILTFRVLEIPSAI